MSEQSASVLEGMKRISKSLQKLNSHELMTVLEASEIESQDDDTSNLAIGSPSPPMLNPGLSFIKQVSLYNLVSSMDASEDFVNVISKEPIHKRPPNSKLLSSQMWESEMDFDYNDGLEKLQKDLEIVDYLQTKSQGNDNSNLATASSSHPKLVSPGIFTKQDPLYSLVSRMGAIEDSINVTSKEPSKDISQEPRASRNTAAILEDIKRISKSLQKLNPQDLKTVFEASTIKSQGVDTSNLDTDSPSPFRLIPNLSFIKQESLYNLATRMEALEDSINVICKESSHRRSLINQVSSSTVWEDDGLEKLQKDLKKADQLQTEPSIAPSIAGIESNDTGIHNSVAGKSSSKIEELCTLLQNQQLVQKQLSEITVERCHLEKWQDEAALPEKNPTLDGQDVNSQKWVTDNPDESYKKQHWILRLLCCRCLC